MRNVAARMRNREAAAAIIIWHEGMDEQRKRERGEGIMRRVGKRMLNKEKSDAVVIWREQQLELKNRLRGEAIMKRVGGRMRNKEVALNFAAWQTNCRGDMASMWKNRIQRLQDDLDAMTMKYAFTTQVTET